MQTERKVLYFRRFGILTIVLIYLLIAVGGLVRSTGSGMGCPDWPRCFGQWIPPTAEAELPSDYREVFVKNRQEKNAKFVKLLQLIGFTEFAEKVSSDPKVAESEPFNALKTWIEYVNRVFGVLVGFFILLTFVFSFIYFSTDRSIVFLSGLGLFLVIVQGILGAFVVYTNLLPSMITAHMILALVIVGVLIEAIFRTYPKEKLLNYDDKFLIISGLRSILGLSLLQVILGTQVREAVDAVSSALNYQNRETWIDQLGLAFYIHRSFSIVVLLANAYLIYLFFKKIKIVLLQNWAKILGVLLLIEILTGVILSYLALPAFMQPIHLLLASLIFGVQYWLLRLCK